MVGATGVELLDHAATVVQAGEEISSRELFDPLLCAPRCLRKEVHNQADKRKPTYQVSHAQYVEHEWI